MTAPNLDKLAALAPFTIAYDQTSDCNCFLGSDGKLLDCDDVNDALNEWAELRATVADLRKWRSEHDCRYTLGAAADIDGIHCPIDDPCVRCQRRMEWDAAQKENAELRAYKQRAEWQPIDTAPKDGTWILLWDAQRKTASSGCWHYESWWVTDDKLIAGEHNDAPTHWMPLISAPKEASDGR